MGLDDLRNAHRMLERKLEVERKELETVAVMTDFGFRRTQQQMLQLADYTQPANTSTTPQK